MCAAKTTKKQGTTDWTERGLPNFHGISVFVTPGAFYGEIVALMAACGMTRASCPDTAQLVVFSGGADISPSIYGENPIPGVYVNEDRDVYESEVYAKCLKLGIPMFGICRGAQFLHAKNKGKLWQDVNNHGGSVHDIVDIELDVRVSATSIHHQMIKPNERLTIIAVCENQVATHFKSEDLFINLKAHGANSAHELEVEAGCYTDTHCIFVQGHPEIGSPEYRSWTMTKVYDFYTEWTTARDGTNQSIINTPASLH